MHFAFLLRHRRRLLMHFDPSKGTPLSSSASVSLKRSLAQQATANARKIPRTEKAQAPATSSLSSSRRGSPPVFSPEFQMPTPSSSSSPNLSSNSSNFHRSLGKRAKRATPPAFKGTGKGNVLDGPMRDMNHIVMEFNQQHPDASELKPVHSLNPKSAVANFETIVFGTLPHYDSVEGLVNGRKIWRCVFYIWPGFVN